MAHIAFRQHFKGNDRVQATLFNPCAVKICKTLLLNILFSLILGHTGVQNVSAALAVRLGRTGEAARCVIGLIRRHRDRQVLPVHQIPAAPVTPVHAVPMGSVGVILIKQVIVFAVKVESIGVVDPANGLNRMKTGAITRIYLILVGSNKSVCPFEHRHVLFRPSFLIP